VRYALTSANGVSEVASIGGFVREYRVDLDPVAMKAHNVSMMMVMEAISLQILITIIAIIIMVFHIRASLMISALLPLAVLMCFILMKYLNTDTPSGLKLITAEGGSVFKTGGGLCRQELGKALSGNQYRPYFYCTIRP